MSMKRRINGFQMAYEDQGQGLPLIFVHGYPLNKALWQPQMEHFREQYRVITPDLRGFGDSETIPGPYSIELLADDLQALITALEIQDRVVLCGLSMGGYVLFAFQRKYPEHLAGLVLTATRATADSPEARANRDNAIEFAYEKGLQPIVESMLPMLLSPKTYEAQPELVERLKTIMMGSSVDGVVGVLSAMKERPDSTPTLAQIHVPTLVIHGEDDRIIPLADVKAMQAAIPGAILAIFPNAGHLPNLEQPARFNQVLGDFLSKI